MFKQGGIAYVYLCYGIHHLFNVVSNEEGIPHAILIRGIQPLHGIDIMQTRTNKKATDTTITRGPGNLSKAMGITTKHDALYLTSNEIFIADDGFAINNKDILATPRIGVDYAAEDALLPYRFIVKGNEYVSGRVR
jgi:DNA-3-methyladenine glycosylase